MKNLARLFGITVLIGLLVTACPTGGGDVGDEVPNSSCPLGPTLTLSGQVYTIEDTGFTPFQGSLSINSVGGIGGNGAVTNGQFSFNISTPNALEPLTQPPVESGGTFTNVQISPADARGVGLNLEITGNPDYNYLFRMDVGLAMSQTLMYISESVYYVYVDRDVTMTGGPGTSSTSSINGSLTLVTSGFNISLKQGWNAMYLKTVYPDPVESQNNRIHANMSMSAANPSHLKWVAQWVDYD